MILEIKLLKYKYKKITEIYKNDIRNKTKN